MKWSNAAHNIINCAIALLGALEFYDWQIFFTPESAVKVAGALALSKIIINVVRDGFTGLMAEQPPVQQ
jgi:hypothetical protein